jgi:hypothetical protein
MAAATARCGHEAAVDTSLGPPLGLSVRMGVKPSETFAYLLTSLDERIDHHVSTIPSVARVAVAMRDPCGRAR